MSYDPKKMTNLRDYSLSQQDETMNKHKAITHKTSLTGHSDAYTAPNQTESYAYTHNSFLWKNKQAPSGRITKMIDTARFRHRAFCCIPITDKLSERNPKVFLKSFLTLHIIHFFVFGGYFGWLMYSFLWQGKDKNDSKTLKIGLEMLRDLKKLKEDPDTFEIGPLAWCLVIPVILQIYALVVCCRAQNAIYKAKKPEELIKMRSACLLCFSIDGFYVFCGLIFSVFSALFYVKSWSGPRFLLKNIELLAPPIMMVICGISQITFCGKVAPAIYMLELRSQDQMFLNFGEINEEKHRIEEEEVEEERVGERVEAQPNSIDKRNKIELNF